MTASLGSKWQKVLALVVCIVAVALLTQPSQSHVSLLFFLNFFHQFHPFSVSANYHRRQNQLRKLLLIRVLRVNYCNSIWPRNPGKVSDLKGGEFDKLQAWLQRGSEFISHLWQASTLKECHDCDLKSFGCSLPSNFDKKLAFHVTS